MGGVAIIGVGQTKSGDQPNLGAGELFAQALADAVADADKGFDPIGPTRSTERRKE
jgi:hypothetical protein